MTTPASNPTPQRVPRATYRLQFNRNFTLRRATELVPYLHDLGVSHFYDSPLLKACPGSAHGYDTCDHSQINPEIGTENNSEDFVAALRRHDIGLVLDIVPNHMGICGRENAWWWDVLPNGHAGRFADHFDSDWDSPDPRLHGMVLLPVLGDIYGRSLERGELKLIHERGEILLAYHEHRFPIAPDTLVVAPGLASEALAQLNADPAALDAVSQKQHYRLSDWRQGHADLNYRRFFDISTLAGIRVEDPRVFGAAHSLVLRWYANGWIDGFRVDHPDGLHDPTEYFERLNTAALVFTSPFVPMLFQGDEWAASTPFQYFTDHADAALAKAVRDGRRLEFASFGWKPEDVPDPQARETFERSKLNWSELKHEPHADLLDWHRLLIQLRRDEPALADGRLDLVQTRFDESARLFVLERGPITVACNLADQPQRVSLLEGRHTLLLASDMTIEVTNRELNLPPDTVVILKS